MKNILLFLTLTTLIYSCGSDPITTENELTGTWILDSVNGTCFLLPFSDSADDKGCIENPTLEVNCSIIEFLPEGEINYAYSLIKGSGTYTINGDNITICTDRCLDYTISGTSLNLQTGTIPDCDPVYAFRKVAPSLDEIIEENKIRKIKTVRKNGKTKTTYSYYPDGKVMMRQSFDDDGDLRFTYNYTHTPINTTLVRTSASTGASIRYDYYNEDINRKRRDYYDENGNLTSYLLYFYEDDVSCSYSRLEKYEEDALTELSNVTYLDNQCSSQTTTFYEGQLSSIRTVQRDNNPAWWIATQNPQFPSSKSHNVTSITTVDEEGNTLYYTFTEVFTYGNDGYPISSVQTFDDGSTAVFTYEYE